MNNTIPFGVAGCGNSDGSIAFQNLADSQSCLNKITLADGKVALDETALKGVREIEIRNIETGKPQMYELVLKMDVYG